jgi:eukaryotic-like serine/threonine-protein kinase
MSHQSKHFYDFGRYRLDAGERLLLCDGEVVPVTPKAFDLLLVLVKHSGHLLKKEELLKAVWADTFVEEANLSWNISHIRKALGDAGDQGRYIETVPKLGYRFVAPVKEVSEDGETLPTGGRAKAQEDQNNRDDRTEASPASSSLAVGPGKSARLERLTDPASTPPAPPAARLKKRERLVWIGVTALLLAVLACGVFYFRRAPADEQAVHLSISPPKKMTLSMGHAPALSPDGRYLALVAMDSAKEAQLYLRALDSPAAQALVGTEGASSPFWSPDSRFLAYFAQGKLKKIPVGGGPPTELCDVAFGWGGSWSRDGVILLSSLDGLRRVSENGDPLKAVVTTVDGARPESSIEARRLWTHFLPDGRQFLFCVTSHRPEIRGIYVGSLDSKATRRLLGTVSNVAYTPPGYLLFVRDLTLMAQPFDAERVQFTGEPFQVADQLTFNIHNVQGGFTVSNTGVLAYIRGGNIRQLVWFDRAGKDLGPVGAPDAYSLPSLSPDEKSVAVTNSNPSIGAPDIWRLDVLRGIPSRFTFDPEWDTTPIWSPDGSRIVFSSWRRGSWDLYQKAANGDGTEELLLESNEEKFPSHWTWNGQFISYNNISAKGDIDVRVLPLFGDREPIPFAQTEFAEYAGHFSPNGRWLAYVSNESGKDEVYVRPFPSGAGIRVSTSGGTQPRWPRHAKELFYQGLDGKLMAVEVTAGKKFEAGTPRALFQMRLAMDFDFSPYTVTADGQRFLISTPVGEAASPTITVVLNWPAALKKAPPQ